ncbi:tetratricopeptide repeat protein [Bacteroides sp. 224]|nr:tetratricopeptide repeat protein [Bacteroides sp. 224]
MSIDYLLPADVNFPAQIKKVGIVNNMSNTPDNHRIVSKDTILRRYENARRVTFHNGDPVIATESFAEALAEQNYFDVVIICDSALRANDRIPREETLSKREVQELTKDLGVDMLIALENLQIKISRVISAAAQGGYWGTIDAKIQPLLTLYIPQRTLPLVQVSKSDSIFWEDSGVNHSRLSTLKITDEEIIKEASEYAGSIPIKYLLPHWTKGARFYYSGGNSYLRDAAIMVKHEEWDKAYARWKQLYDKNSKKKNKKRMFAAFNIALYHEMSDSIPEAQKWLKEAIELAAEIIDHRYVPAINQHSTTSNQVMYRYYGGQLNKRNKANSYLEIQMGRFNEEKTENKE